MVPATARQSRAAYGWMWSSKYEARTVEQVRALLQPITRAMADHDMHSTPDRCFAIWALYYVDYRSAVVQGASAVACLNAIKGSLALLLK